MKIMTVVGTRPEIIKLSRVLVELDRCATHILVHTGQNYDYELNEVFFKQLGIRKPDYFLGASADTPAKTIANTIAGVDEVLAKEQPDAFLIYGDTNSCLSVIAAKRRKVPIFHMEAGNRCFDLRVPEEINRRIVDHTSDINMVLTEHARRYLLAEGIRPESIMKTGSSMKEVLDHYVEQIEQSQILDDLKLSPSDFFVVSAHREENVDNAENLKELLETFNVLAITFDKRVIVSTHPRTRKRLEEQAQSSFDPRVEFHKPFGFFDYIKLQKTAACVVSDSGTITEESSILGFPAVMIRKTHERPEGMDEGTAMMCGLSADRVVEAVRIILAQQRTYGSLPRVVGDYDVDDVSRKVVRIIFSYVDSINRNTWHKET